MPVAASTIPYAVSYWNAYRFSGFGDYVSTTRDLFRFHRALPEGRLVAPGTLAEAYTLAPLNDGTPNSVRFGLGWQISSDSLRP